MIAVSHPKQRGTEELWLDAAYRLLTESGVEAVKVMPLAKSLGLSRTSFYWHFKDREALLEAMVTRWEARNSGNLEARCVAYAETICEAMLNICDCWLMPELFDSRLDLAIRNWARTDPVLHPRVEQADGRRIKAITDVFLRFGYPSQEAEVRAMTVLYTQLGYISMQIEERPETRLARIPAYVAVFTGREPSETEFARFRARHTG
ncbi:TetR/AcrR family transcriptional regulator [Aliiruegeria sabulilitoris]|uniref:TetR/AcrR family transcriptional regulator n=1 Tax=Aliiruegeria sabulilitoris TaxID=1510458 RepID=UPI00082E3E6A|nr:TetR/AcrR family transcriptional regulator [Aliiruegeria sabulilitoris]NDR59480.1 TetR/AcrR family transcriptional regulator [Pseudoruegeria sp. M32A2M]